MTTSTDKLEIHDPKVLLFHPFYSHPKCIVVSSVGVMSLYTVGRHVSVHPCLPKVPSDWLK